MATEIRELTRAYQDLQLNAKQVETEKNLNKNISNKERNYDNTKN